MYQYKAIIDRVVDGDTIDVSVDLGFDTWTKQRLRLYGIDAPESSTVLGKGLKAQMITALPAGLHVSLTSYKHDKYGRYLADIYIGETFHSINEQLIHQGLAKPYLGDSKSGLWTAEELAQTCPGLTLT